MNLVRCYDTAPAFEADMNELSKQGIVLHSWHTTIVMAYPKDRAPHPVVGFFAVFVEIEKAKTPEPMRMR